MFKLLLTVFLLANIALVQSKNVKKMENSTYSGAVCQICTNVLGYAQTLLENNASETLVINYINQNFCAKLGPLNQACSQYVDQNGPKILYELGQKIAPSIICHEIGVCSTLKSKNNIKSIIKNVEAPGPVCQVCNVVLGYAQSLLVNNASETEVLQFIEKEFCSNLGALKQICIQFFDQNGREILYELGQKIDPSIVCNKFGLCQNFGFSKKVSNENQLSGAVCQVCTVVLGFAQTLLENNASETEIMQFIKQNFCSNLGPLNQMCSQYIDENGRHILYVLGQDLEPSIVCHEIGVCATLKSIKTKKIEAPPSPSCQICTAVLGYAENLLENNATELQVIQFIENEFCNRIGVLSQICVQYIQENGQNILYELGLKIAPSLICNKYGFCKQFSNSLNIKPLAGPECAACKLVFQKVVDLLKENKTEDELIKYIENNLCNRTGKLSAECKALVDQFGPILIYELANGVNPETLCKLLTLCTASESGKPVSVPVQATNPAECAACKLVFQKVVDLLKENKTEDQLIKYIEDNLCNRTGKLSAECKALVDQFGPILIYELANGINPATLCKLVTLCTASESSKQVVLAKSVVPQAKLSDGTICIICEYAVSFIENELKNNVTEAAIISSLDKACNLVPQTYKDQCEAIINSYGVSIIQLLLQLADPSKVCNILNLCSK